LPVTFGYAKLTQSQRKVIVVTSVTSASPENGVTELKARSRPGDNLC
jgi:hypothetical protein